MSVGLPIVGDIVSVGKMTENVDKTLVEASTTMFLVRVLIFVVLALILVGVALYVIKHGKNLLRKKK